MADTQPETDNYKVIKRRCRIVLEVPISITEITPGSVADDFTPNETGEGLTWEWAERQNRFLLALLQDEAALNLFLSSIATGDFGFLMESDRIKGLSDEEENTLFEKVFTMMDSDDRSFFHDARNDGILNENIELIHKAFVTDWKRAEVKDVRVIKQNGE